MKRLVIAMVVLIVLVQLSELPQRVARAESPVPTPAAVVLVQEPKAIVSAKAYGVFDMETGELLFAQNADQVLPIASVTKLFTAAAVCDLIFNDQGEYKNGSAPVARAAADTPITITAADVATEGRAGKLRAGEVYTAQELLFPLLLESSNDAGAALSRTLGPITLAGRELADGTGLSSRNQASVKELASSVRELYRTMPHIFDITTLSQKVGEYTGWVNNSPVYDLPGYRGGKHGYTEAAGRTLVAVFSEASLGGRELGYVLLGSDDVKQDAEALRAAMQDSVVIQ